MSELIDKYKTWLMVEDIKNRNPDMKTILREVQRGIKTMPSIEPAPHWIPVSEALPEDKGEYLVTYHPRHWDIVENEIKVGLDTFRGKTSWAKKKYQLVIAWCKKPSPYLLESER